MSKDSISSKLRELFELYQSGTITKEEYELLKSELISGSNKQTSETIDENQEPDNPELNIGSKSGETTNDDGIKEVDNNPVKDEEENPAVDSKPEIKPKKQKPIGILIIIVAVVISLVVGGISLN